MSNNQVKDFKEQRLKNLQRLQEAGYSPYGDFFDRSGRLMDIRESFEEGKNIAAAGRLMTKREMGKSVFAHLQDSTGSFQIYLKKNEVGEGAMSAFKILDLGDHIGVEGTLFLTKTGEPTLKVDKWTLLSKSLQSLPDKWDGLQDVETRYRQRYLDLISNSETREVFFHRIRIIEEIRKFLRDKDFLEVETPMLQAMAGGAAANPFKTRYQALGVDMFLRIAPELYLKRLLVGGFDKVFELNRNFRNEGISRDHNPEFTMLEIYQAYGDLDTMKSLVQTLITHIAEKVLGTLQVGSEEHRVDLSQWETVAYHDLIAQAAGNNYVSFDLEEKKARARELGCELEPDWNEVEVTQEIFEKVIEKTLINPTFVTRLPAELVPLARKCKDDDRLVDVFELIIGGREIAPGYTELNDPIEQRKRFELQAEKEGSILDEDFLEALEYGMPPAGGMGVGIDRLIMLLTGSKAIRDVILFPQLKPKI